MFTGPQCDNATVRGFLLVACSVLLAIGIGVAVIAAGSASSDGTTAEAFAHRLLAEASVPPGARSTTKVRSTWLKFPLDNPAISGLIDLHRFYLVENPPDAVESYVESHLPKGAKVNETTTSSGPTGTATGVSVSLSVSGPHQYFAQLTYDVASVGAHAAELRVDASTVWLPNRPVEERAPAGGVVEVTWFSRVSYAEGSSGPVTVLLSGAHATTLRRVLNALPLGPSPTICMEEALLYKIVFRPTLAAASSFEADSWTCSGVLVTSHGRKLSPIRRRLLVVAHRHRPHPSSPGRGYKGLRM